MAHYDCLEQEAFLNLWRTYDRLKAIEEQFFARYGLSAQQYNALRLLQAAHPNAMTVSELGGRLISRAPDMTRLLDRLEERGLVRRERLADDRRTVRVVITAEGLRLLGEIAGPLLECHRKQLGHVAPSSLRRLIRLLQQARAPHERPSTGDKAGTLTDRAEGQRPQPRPVGSRPRRSAKARVARSTS
jgi:DNA-binding MarR family transcriptional regulator